MDLPPELIDGILKNLTFDEITACYYVSQRFHVLTGRYILEEFIFNLHGTKKSRFVKHAFGDFGKSLVNGWYDVILCQPGINYKNHNFDKFIQSDRQKVISILSDNITAYCRINYKLCESPHKSCIRCENVICEDTEIKLKNVYKFAGIPSSKLNKFRSGLGGTIEPWTYTRDDPSLKCNLCDFKWMPMCFTCTYGIPRTVNEVTHTPSGDRLLVSYISVLPHCKACKRGYCQKCVRTCSFCAKIMCTGRTCDKFIGVTNWQCRDCKLEKYSCTGCQVSHKIKLCEPCLDKRMNVLL